MLNKESVYEDGAWQNGNVSKEARAHDRPIHLGSNAPRNHRAVHVSNPRFIPIFHRVFLHAFVCLIIRTQVNYSIWSVD